MFFDIGVKDIIDVLLVAFLLYYTYKLMKASAPVPIDVCTGYPDIHIDLVGSVAGIGDEVARFHL